MKAYLFLIFLCMIHDITAQSLMYRGNPQLTGISATKAVNRVKGMKFAFKTEGAIRCMPAEFNNVLYFGNGAGIFYALNSTSGVEIWRSKTNAAISSSPAVTDGVVYFTNRDNVLYALEATTGKELWQFKMGPDVPYLNGWDYYLSSPIVTEGNIFVGSGDGHIYCISVKTKKQIWKFDVGARIRTTPAVINNRVVFGSMDGYVYSVDKVKGTLQWKFATRGAALKFDDFGFDPTSILCSPSVTDKLVVIGGRDGFVYAIDLTNGTEKWRVDHQGSWVLGNAVDQTTAFVSSGSSSFVQALDVVTGAEKWRFKALGAIFSSPTVAGDMLYFCDYQGNLYGIQNKTGSLQWRFPMGKRSFSTPVVSNGIVYCGSDEGVMFALEANDEPTDEHVTPRKIVYWESARSDKAFNWFTNSADIIYRDYFKGSGYEVVDGVKLKQTMEELIQSKTPSVIVFASNRIPHQIAEETSHQALLRQYLNAGGKIVYLGPDPLAYYYNAGDGLDSLDFQGRPAKITDILYDEIGGINNGYMLGARPTPDGTRWGLRGWWVTTGAINLSSASTILARNEYGIPSCWVKSYGGPVGTGLVQLGAPKDGIGPDLYSIKAVVEYGLEW